MTPDKSPSTRREWIEIVIHDGEVLDMLRLPPHGGSGLKLRITNIKHVSFPVSLHTEGVD